MAGKKELKMNVGKVVEGQDNDINFDDANIGELSDLLEDVPEGNNSINFKAENSEPENRKKSIDAEIDELQNVTTDDFANFDIDDFDSALRSYQGARAGKQLKSSSKSKGVVSEVNGAAKSVSSEEAKPKPQKLVEEPVEPKIQRSVYVERDDMNQANLAQETKKPFMVKPSTISETGTSAQDASQQQEFLNWYMGSLKDKSYKISPDNMPEFLDTDKTIRVLHVSVDSTYGWNVFFDNGIFMSLKDLKEYQERHGEIPCQDGRIIYGNKSCSFERILKIVVYETPRYFSYVAK